MKTTFAQRSHLISPDKPVIEIWADEEFMGTINVLPGEAGIRVITKHGLHVSKEPDPTISILEVRLVRKPE
jgi:hypothetical protein